MDMVGMLMIEAGLRHGVESSALSFSNAMRLATATSLEMSTAPVCRSPGLYEDMLAGAAAERAPERPGRYEPRARSGENGDTTRVSA